MKTTLDIPSPVRTHNAPGLIGIMAFEVLLFLGPAATLSLINVAKSQANTVGASPDVGAHILPVEISSDAIHASNYGTVGNGTVNDTSALQAAENAATGKTLYIEPGTYLTSGLTIDGPTRVIAYNVTLKAAGGDNDLLSLPSPVSVEGIRLDGNGTTKAGMKITATGSGAKIFNCVVTNIRHNQNDASINIWNAQDFVVDHCTVDKSAQNGIEIIFSSNGRVTNNKVTNSDNNGIQWWGGDSAQVVTFGVSDIVIAGNLVANSIAGIWGSKGQRITVNNNTINECEDVCLDFEGGFDGLGSYNSIRNGKNGAMTVFYKSENITFDHNVVVQDTGVDAGFKSYGVGTNQNTRVTNNTIATNGSPGILIPGYGPVTNSTFSGNDITLLGGSQGIQDEIGDPTNTFSNNTIHEGSPTPPSCTTLYSADSTAPAGYASSWNLFTPAKELLLNATCNGSNLNVSAGNTASFPYVYKTGYYWDGSSWQPYTFTGATPVGDWYQRTAQATIPRQAGTTYFVGFTCQQLSGGWKCGCSDSACAAPNWQLQGVE